MIKTKLNDEVQKWETQNNCIMPESFKRHLKKQIAAHNKHVKFLETLKTKKQ